MKLQTKYSLAILTLVLALGFSFSGLQLWYYQRSLNSFATTGSAAIESAMLAELQTKQKLLVEVLAKALTNPVYQLDMAKIQDVIHGVMEHHDVRNIYVYDKKGIILYDGTTELILYGSPLSRKSTERALTEKHAILESAPTTLTIDVPILIADEGLLGGISVAFALDSIHSEIEKRKHSLAVKIREDTKRQLIILSFLAVSFSIAGLLVSIYLGRAWSKPIRILSSLTQKIGKGDYDISVPIKGSDEIAHLGRSFSSMVAKLSELRIKETYQSEALRQSNLELQEINENLLKEISERERAENELLSQNQRIQVLHEIGSAMQSTLDKKVLAELLFDKVQSLLPYAAITVQLFNEDTDQLEPIAARNIDQKTWINRVQNCTGSEPKGHGSTVFERGVPIIIENLQTDLGTRNTELFQSHGLISFIGVPLATEGKILGVLGFYYNEKHLFSKEETDFLSTLGAQVAAAIHNIQLYERILKQALELESANKSKDEFLSVMSHELRTPLNVITGYADVLSQGILGEVQREQLHAVKTISFQSNELLRMINEILQIGSIEAGKVKATLEEVDLDDLLIELKSGYEVLANKEIKMKWNIESSLPLVNTDRQKLKHILQNLINNAVKFTDKGSVTISAAWGDKSVEFEVKDTGIGIPHNMLPSIFQMFRQLDSSNTRSYGGAGVGLYIVKKFVDLINGTIKVDSILGQGSTFTITLPLQQSDKHVEPNNYEVMYN